MPPRHTPKSSSRRAHAIQHGYRSGLEEQIGDQLAGKGISFLYEEVKIPFTQPAKERKYTPDFILPNGIVVETKGRFVTADRQKHQLIQAQYPDLDLRFVFSNARTRISKQSKTTYEKWCKSKGFHYADKVIPDAWLKEPADMRSLRCLMDILGPDAAHLLNKFNVIL